MPRNNQNRIGSTNVTNTAAETPPAQNRDSSFDPLSFVTPTEFIELPSKGLFYPEGHPLHMQESLEIRFMTAKDEDILTSRTLLKQGVAIERFLQNIIIDRRVDVRDMLVGDKNAIIVAARSTGYGSDYETKITCPACQSVNEFTFDLTNAKVYHGDSDSLTKYDIHRTDNGTFILRLPVYQIDVELRLLTGKDETAMIKQMEANKKNNKPEGTISEQIRRMLVSVNSEADSKLIRHVMDNMPTKDTQFLRRVYKLLVPNVDLTHEFQCTACNYEGVLEVPFTADFFWPNR